MGDSPHSGAARHLPVEGDQLEPLHKPRLTSSHIVRWAAAQQNWDKIHYDQAFCEGHAGLPKPVINGALKQHFIAQFLWERLPTAWPWRIDYQFRAPDYVGERVTVRGTVGVLQRHAGSDLVEVLLEIFNEDRCEVTTRGRAIVVLSPGEQRMQDALNFLGPEDQRLPLDVSAGHETDGAPAEAVRCLGQSLDQRTSAYPVDLGRLRLFADAVMGLDPVHFDPSQAAAAWGGVVAPPLFPLHSLQALPGSFPLSEDDGSQGREGVNEIGRDLAERFGLPGAGGMNAGNRVQIHSLVRPGERVRADSKLVGVRRRAGAGRREMVFLETLNTYAEDGGRPLLTERQTMVFKL